jgi:hypothetical protein
LGFQFGNPDWIFRQAMKFANPMRRRPSLAIFANMPDLDALRGFAGSPCLVFPASHSLAKVKQTLLGKLAGFFQTWETHGAAVEGAASVLENRFLVVAHRQREISGCSRDDLLFFVRGLGRECGIEWLGGAHIFYRDESGLPADVDRAGYKKLFQEGRITFDTVVYDTTILKTDAILEGRFALPASRSWHARLMTHAAVPV